jgi:hypothetical protein
VTGSLLPAFTWSVTIGATNYTLQVSKNNAFTQLVIHKTVAGPTYTPSTNPPDGILLFWRVKVDGPYKPSAWSDTFWFSTP